MDIAHRRSTDQTKLLLERIVLWSLAFGALAAAATAYVRVKDTVDLAPKTARAVRKLDKRVDMLEWYVPEIGKKLGVQAPPPGWGDERKDEVD